MSPQTYIDPVWLSRAATAVAPDLIGCMLVRQMPDRTTWKGMIVETEAYEPNDPAMHAYRKPTQRNQIMFSAAGVAYIYLIYGSYHCLNIVTDSKGVPSSVLIRALQLMQIPPWIEPQQALKSDRIAAGPGKLCRALNIDRSLNGTLLQPNQALWLEHRSPAFQEAHQQGIHALIQTTRIGLTQGVDLPWRWYLASSKAVSKKARNNETMNNETMNDELEVTDNTTLMLIQCSNLSTYCHGRLKLLI